ncbi:hypothetical protein WS64_11975 [Burkholderia anthina]|uniref:Uncharacterized protein n=1 Tax=Burkholderia anthina TaxID=179879 RepID=A0AAW3Q4U9_9BURK|nr:hypothetical protein WS64_11975 [Burkholderia anthina]
MRRVLENRLMHAAGVVSARRCPCPKVVPHGTRARPDAVTRGHATPSCERVPAQRGSVARRVRDGVSPRVVRRRRDTVQTVGDDTRRSISTEGAHHAAQRRAGRRLK